MTALTPYFVVAWVFAMIGMFPILGRPRRAVLFIVISGMLFLPEAVPNTISIGPVNFSKHQAISYAAFCGALLFNPGRFFSIRMTVFDLPAIVWCLCPFPSVLTNNAPPDGSSIIWGAISQTWIQVVSFGIPYVLGRAYFTDRESFRDLGIGIVTGALFYVPFCLYEVRMSPQLHTMVYGYFQHAFDQTFRAGGYRPMVFFPHGLSLAMFMLSATIFAWLMWWGGEFHRSKGVLNIVLRYSPWVLLVNFLLLKSTGALFLGLAGAITFLMARLTNSRWILLSLVMVPILYASVRSNSVWNGESLVQFVTANLSLERAQSLETRLVNETLLVQKAFGRPWFGWGGWARNHVFDEDTGEDITITDGLWIITLGNRGIIGLISLGAFLLLPVVRFAFRISPSKYLQWSPVTSGAFVVTLWTIDSLPNAMPLPIYFLIVGGLTGLRPTPKDFPIRVPASVLQPT